MNNFFAENRFVFEEAAPEGLQCSEVGAEATRRRVELSFFVKKSLEERRDLSLSILKESDKLLCSSVEKDVAYEELQKYSKDMQREVNDRYNGLEAELERKRQRYVSQWSADPERQAIVNIDREDDEKIRRQDPNDLSGEDLDAWHDAMAKIHVDYDPVALQMLKGFRLKLQELRWERAVELEGYSVDCLTAELNFGQYEGLSALDKKLFARLGVKSSQDKDSMVEEYRKVMQEMRARYTVGRDPDDASYWLHLVDTKAVDFEFARSHLSIAGLDSPEKMKPVLSRAMLFLKERGKNLDHGLKGEIMFDMMAAVSCDAKDAIAFLDRAIALMTFAIEKLWQGPDAESQEAYARRLVLGNKIFDAKRWRKEIQDNKK